MSFFKTVAPLAPLPDNLIPSNIRENVNIAGVIGNVKPNTIVSMCTAIFTFNGNQRFRVFQADPAVFSWPTFDYNNLMGVPTKKYVITSNQPLNKIYVQLRNASGSMSSFYLGWNGSSPNQSVFNAGSLDASGNAYREINCPGATEFKFWGDNDYIINEIMAWMLFGT